jgi:hypothetical protein
MQKTPKRRYLLIFMNFEVKKFIVKKIQRKEALMFESYNLVDPME